VGDRYTDSSFERIEVPFALFVDYVEDFANSADTSSAPRLYLAQHQLFSQIPDLEADIEEPVFCQAGVGDIYSVNAWFGPSGTVSPLHHDPTHNILSQVHGSKYVRLYGPEENVYPNLEFGYKNTSLVDVDAVDAGKFPEFSSLPYLEVELQEGDALFIPRKWCVPVAHTRAANRPPCCTRSPHCPLCSPVLVNAVCPWSGSGDLCAGTDRPSPFP
jgi:lysine-specific demethylase 8